METSAAKNQLSQNDLLISIGSDLATNFRPRGIPCRVNRWCRSPICSHCSSIHRRHFINEVVFQHSKLPFEFLITFGLTAPSGLLAWTHLKRLGQVATFAHGRVPGAHVRILSMSEGLYPHVHILSSGPYFRSIERRGRIQPIDSKKRIYVVADLQIDLKIDPVNDISGLAGYLFDKNYHPTLCMASRPPRLRLLASSKGPRLGFPSNQKGKISSLGATNGRA